MTTPLDKLQSAIKRSALDGLFLSSPANRLYATGFCASAGAVLITQEEAVFITDFRYYGAARRLSGIRVRQTDAENTYEKLIGEWLSDHAIQRLGVEEKSLTWAEYKKYEERLRAALHPASDLIMRERMVKTPGEVVKIESAQRIAEKALDETLPLIKEGVSEREIAAELIWRMIRGGAEKSAFDPIVVSGANGALPHGKPSDKRFVAGEFITMDFGCVKDGYCSDMTRTVALGYATGKMKKIYETVLAAQQAGIRAARSGVSGAFVDDAARRVIGEAGYGACFGHGFGHGVGVELHEEPTFTPKASEATPIGAVLSAEPGIYLPGEMGVRIEDLLYIEEEGARNLTNSPKNLIIVG